jgi:hypothetical protein
MKRLDVFRKIQRDLLVTTHFGASLSIVCVLVMIYLCGSESIRYFENRHGVNVSALTFPSSQKEEMTVRFNITMLKCPCAFIDIQSHNIFGEKGRFDEIRKESVLRATATGRKLLYAKPIAFTGIVKDRKRRGLDKNNNRTAEKKIERSPPPSPTKLTQKRRPERKRQAVRFEMLKDYNSENIFTARRGCIGWRQTKDCDPSGSRESKHDLTCKESVPGDVSGFCECFGGYRTAAVGCVHDVFTCEFECGHAWDLHQEARRDVDAIMKGNKNVDEKEDNLFECEGVYHRRFFQEVVKTKDASEILQLRSQSDGHGSCRIEGQVRVRSGMVPGGLLFSSRIEEERMLVLGFDMSHHVEDLVFDDGGAGRFDGKNFISDDVGVRSYEHFAHLVETNVLDEDENILRTYFDYTGSSTDHETDRSCHSAPYVHFVWDFEAYALNRWYNKGQSFLSFLVSLFAILGGVLTITSVFDGTIFSVFYNRKLSLERKNYQDRAVRRGGDDVTVYFSHR